MTNGKVVKEKELHWVNGEKTNYMITLSLCISQDTGCYTREDLNVMTSVMRESLFNCRQAIFGRFLCVSLSHM